MKEPTMPDYKTREKSPAAEELETELRSERYEYIHEKGLDGELRDVFTAIVSELVKRDPSSREKLMEFFEGISQDRKRVMKIVSELNSVCAENVKQDNYRDEEEIRRGFAVDLAGRLYDEYSEKR
ncbi:hypothetical protein ACFL2R_01140 [Patescibacteria group bacterium]